MLTELEDRTETLGVAVMIDDEGETGREASTPHGIDGFLPRFGGGIGDLLREALLPREVTDRLVMLRPPNEGRLYPCWLFWASSCLRMALPWASMPKPSISFWVGFCASSQSRITWSMGGGGEGKPSSSQYVCSTV